MNTTCRAERLSGLFHLKIGRARTLRRISIRCQAADRAWKVAPSRSIAQRTLTLLLARAITACVMCLLADEPSEVRPFVLDLAREQSLARAVYHVRSVESLADVHTRPCLAYDHLRLLLLTGSPREFPPAAPYGANARGSPLAVSKSYGGRGAIRHELSEAAEV